MSLNNFIPELWEKEFTPKQHFKKLTINIKDNDGGEFGFDALTEIKGGMQIIDAIKDALIKPEIADELIKEMAEEVADTMLSLSPIIDYISIIESWERYFTNKLKNK